MDFEAIKKAAAGYQADMNKFLRDLIAIPGESADETGHVMRIKEEMEKVGFDEVVIDGMGNVMGQNHEGFGPAERQVQDSGRRLRPGRGLRRPVLAVHYQRG